MRNNSVPKFIFRLSRFPVYRGSVLGRFYCIWLSNWKFPPRLLSWGEGGRVVASTPTPLKPWGSVVVKALGYKSVGPGIDCRCRRGFFPLHLTDRCALGPTQLLKVSTRISPGGKGSRCVRLTTYNLHVPIVKKSGALTSWKPVGLLRPVMGQLYQLYTPHLATTLKRE